MIATDLFRSQDGKKVVAGQAFVPEVSLDCTNWYPICGPGFWDSDDRATTVCNALGFYTGKVKRTEETYSVDAVTWGNFSFGRYENSNCKKGNRIGVRVICTFSYPLVHGLIIIACVAVVIGVSVKVVFIIIGRCKRMAAMERYLRVCETEEYQNEVRRQWLRVFEAIGAPSHSLYSTIPRVARADPEVSQMIEFFRSRPGLRTIVGGQITLFYAPPSALDFACRSKCMQVKPIMRTSWLSSHLKSRK